MNESRYDRSAGCQREGRQARARTRGNTEEVAKYSLALECVYVDKESNGQSSFKIRQHLLHGFILVDCLVAGAFTVSFDDLIRERIVDRPNEETQRETVRTLSIGA